MENKPTVAIITGASSGIGEGVAWRLARKPGTRLILVARREDRLRELAKRLSCEVTWIAADLTEPDAPGRILAHAQEHHPPVNLLVNNAGAAWRATFAEGGYENVRRTMEINFDAVLRLTETFLPMLRESAPSSIVNIASTAGRVSRPGSAAYSASKYALIGWSDGLHLEEAPHGVHVGLVLPGFIKTEGFPADELTGKFATRWMVSDVFKASDAVYETAILGKAERYVPRPYELIAILKILAPGLVRKVLSGGAGKAMTTSTGADAAEQAEKTRT
ncbi:MAG: SDR family NAD(P)-dependent oxidoreductase [Solirubrobacterales bacterium]|jgi:short-subunit dehydrogenase|nr:SDR family NAD(P)-dependent oxidoreductase [Solirubrobacterales bacterium]